jgi:hypothetical protein
MNKTTSMVLVAAVAGIMVAATLAVTTTSQAFAFLNVRGGDGGISGAGGAGGTAIGGTSFGGTGNHNNAIANGGDSGDANGGNACFFRCNAGS